MPYKSLLYSLRGITPEEFVILDKILVNFSENEAREYVAFYSGKRTNPTDILLFSVIGLFGIAGIQRFIIGQVGMGILYFLTCGLCLIGTIVDAINYKSLALEHNQRVAFECARMVRRTS